MVELQQSHVYRVIYKIPGERGRWEATMTYLGANKFPMFKGQKPETRETSWSLRPLAGTQTLQVGWIMGVEDLGQSQGRDDSRHKLKRRYTRA